MREELELALIQDFPDFIGSMNQVLMKLLCVLDLKLVMGGNRSFVKLSEKIYSLVQKYNSTLETEDYKFAVIQVKEKFGGLRYYTNWHIEEIGNIINEYEGRSYSTCEECGKPGKASGRNWFVTLCPVHEKERKERGK